jgi:hypothetical protein
MRPVGRAGRGGDVVAGDRGMTNTRFYSMLGASLLSFLMSFAARWDAQYLLSDIFMTAMLAFACVASGRRASMTTIMCLAELLWYVLYDCWVGNKLF